MVAWLSHPPPRILNGDGPAVPSFLVVAFSIFPVRCLFIPHLSSNRIVRIGTWNLGNRPRRISHSDFLLEQHCDVWLLTEVNSEWFDPLGTRVLDFHAHRSIGEMSPGQFYAAVLSKCPLTPIDSPHFASSAAKIDGITYCSSVLPWRRAHIDCKGWDGDNLTGRCRLALDELLARLPIRDLVWGGDWNHSLMGEEHAGSLKGRYHILAAIEKLDLKVPTSRLWHRGDKCFAIDHIGVPLRWGVDRVQRIDATKLSDHDAYVVEVSSR